MLKKFICSTFKIARRYNFLSFFFFNLLSIFFFFFLIRKHTQREAIIIADTTALETTTMMTVLDVSLPFPAKKQVFSYQKQVQNFDVGLQKKVENRDCWGAWSFESLNWENYKIKSFLMSLNNLCFMWCALFIFILCL